MKKLEVQIIELTGSEKLTKEILALLPPGAVATDQASQTCNLCKAKAICHVKRIVESDLNGYVREELIFNDFDDIWADLATICHSFQAE